jgi:ABC-2 type transport system ATP-binding protein
MADIQKLCERVIVIHRGSKIYDGNLDRLESSAGNRQKIVTFLPGLSSVEGPGLGQAEGFAPGSGPAFPNGWSSRFGPTTRTGDGKFIVRVPSENVVAVSQEILNRGPVADITIEDIPLEDVIAELFQSQ